MSRLDLITIGIVVVCLAALSYLVYKIVNLMNPPEEPTPTSIQDAYTTENPDDLVYTDVGDEDTDWDDDEAGSSISDEDPMGSESSDSSGSQYSASDADGGELDGDYAGGDNSGGGSDGSTSSSGSDSGRSTSSSDSGASSAATTSYSNTSGRYMVAAGSFRVRANADRLVRKLQGMGYDNARVNIFDRGSYAVVIVDRFDSYSKAKQMVTTLANSGVDAIVREKN